MIDRLLLVEDNPADARLIQELLSESSLRHAEIICTGSLRDALAELDRKEFTAALLDLALPDSDGEATLTRLLKAAPNLPVIVFTGLHDEHVGQQLLKAGAQDYLVKGEVDGQSLAKALRFAIERQRLLSVAAREVEVRATNRELETILHITSHDLREPLRAIENFSRLLLDEYGDRLDDTGGDWLARIARAAHRLDQMLNELLTLSRARHIEPETQPLDGDAIVAEVLRRLDDQITATEADVRVTGGFPAFRVDKTWAVHALYNLVANALKFTCDGEPPRIEIVSYTTNDSEGQGIAVLDRGPGVPPEQAGRIFELFRRGVGREVAGTGAGLAIVRQIAESHGGKAWIQSRDGGGSMFVITLPTA